MSNEIRGRDGCEYFSSCLSCPLLKCVHEGGPVAQRMKLGSKRLIVEARRGGRPWPAQAPACAQLLGQSPRNLVRLVRDGIVPPPNEREEAERRAAEAAGAVALTDAQRGHAFELDIGEWELDGEPLAPTFRRGGARVSRVRCGACGQRAVLVVSDGGESVVPVDARGLAPCSARPGAPASKHAQMGFGGAFVGGNPLPEVIPAEAGPELDDDAVGAPVAAIPLERLPGFGDD